MPTQHCSTIDHRRFEKCRHEAACAMLASTWNGREGKFNEVCVRKAWVLYRAN